MNPNYEIDKKSLKFSSVDKKSLNGYFDFKPFYLKAAFNYDGISTKDILKNDHYLLNYLNLKFLIIKI